MRLAEKVAVVTGSSRGIGAAIARRLAAEGAKVVLNCHASADAAEAVAEEIRQADGEAMVVVADVSRFDEAQRLIREALDAYGRVDILVNNAGTTRDALLLMMKEDTWDLVMETNLKSVFNCCKAVARRMVRQRSGRIINITSVVGLIGQAGQTNYAASKAGIIGFTKSLARELGSRNITVNCVAPGYIPTALTEVLPDELKQGILQRTPLGRMGQPEEVAAAVAFLASDDAAFITGHVLNVDGGLAMC
ncbi:MAG: 3-oxoacyl-[acyl-carrier-protein] reductase [Anaerolineae bacterium]|nr:3-oxoacyl-[acyl-carrier-protein] reductase [Anaerolineae bacterium]